MREYWTVIISFVVSIVSAVASISAYLTSNRGGKKKQNTLIRYLDETSGKIAFLCFTAIFSFILGLILYLPRNTTTEKTEDVVTTSIRPSYLSSLKKIPLDEESPLTQSGDAFFINQWDSFTDIIVDGVPYSHGIGIQVPQTDVNLSPSASHQPHDEKTEYIEYRLRNKYEGITFSIGIDETSLEDYKNGGPACLSRIYFESMDSCENSKKANYTIYDSQLFDYRFAKYDIYVDLTHVDILRISAYWKYDASKTRQNCMNLAIVNPVLYKKTEE
jgi:hypothetical protein